MKVVKKISPFPTMHAFCGLGMDSDFLKTMPTNSKIFCTVDDYGKRRS